MLNDVSVRFMAVVFPVSSLAYRTITNAKIAIALTWVTPLLLVVPVWYAHNLLTVENREFAWLPKPLSVNLKYFRYFLLL